MCGGWGEMCGCLGGRWCQVGDRHFALGKYGDLEKKSLLNIGILNKKKGLLNMGILNQNSQNLKLKIDF